MLLVFVGAVAQFPKRLKNTALASVTSLAFI
jgi:hypothetical protein